jgi:very-short-patch-repair endonuclease
LTIQLYIDAGVAEYNTLMAKHRRFPFIFKPVPSPALRPARSVLLVSPIEDAFWRAHERLKLWPLAGLVRQYKVGQYRLDFALPKFLIGIELDGYRTHSSTQAIADDHKRQRWLESGGWYIIRFGGLEVYQDADGCVREAAQLVHRNMRRRQR